MDNSELIENYFTSSLGPGEVSAFENRILSDPEFAEEVAFYVSVHTIAREESQSEKKNHFRELYQKSQNSAAGPNIATSRRPVVRKLVYYIAAAAVVTGVIFGLYTFNQPVSPSTLATAYENKELKNLPVTMSSGRDSIQIGLDLYNKGKLNEALVQFETIIQSDSSDSRAIKNAGLACLGLKEYDKALSYFQHLETHRELFSNPALLYQALTLMERNQSGDVAKAKLLLQQVVQNDLEGKETAREWLKKM